MTITDEERTQIATQNLEELGFRNLEPEMQSYMIQAYALGMLEMSIIDQEEGILDTQIQISKLKGSL